MSSPTSASRRESAHILPERAEASTPPSSSGSGVTRTPTLRLKASFTLSSHPATILEHLVYPSVFKQPFADPHETLCHLFNVRKITLELASGQPVPQTLNLPLLHDSRTPKHLPTHVLAVLDTPSSPPGTPPAPVVRPLIVPVNADLFAKGFNHGNAQELQRLATATTVPAPHWDPDVRAQVVTLPVRVLRVPHPQSLPLLLLFGLEEDALRLCTVDSLPYSRRPSPIMRFPPCSFGTRHEYDYDDDGALAPTPTPDLDEFVLGTGLLATYLLPLAVIEEFPSVAAMPEIMVLRCSDEELNQYVAFNTGLWRNALHLAPKDQAIIDIVRTALRVARDARQIGDLRRSERENEGEEVRWAGFGES